jgi:hypothetical protein
MPMGAIRPELRDTAVVLQAGPSQAAPIEAVGDEQRPLLLKKTFQLTAA